MTGASGARASGLVSAVVLLVALGVWAVPGLRVPSQTGGTADVASCLPAQSAAVMWSCRIPRLGNVVHGLSGLFYDAATATLWAASDDTDSFPDDPTRLLEFDLTARVALAGTLSLKRQTPAVAGTKPLEWQLEAMAPVLNQGSWTGAFFVATEGDQLSRFASAIYRCTATGDCRQEVQLPAAFETQHGNGASGIQNNRGLEGLSISPDGTKLFAALESPLAQDVRGSDHGRVRLLEYALDGSGAPVRQYVYRLDAAPAKVDPIRGLPGISEILAISSTEMLVLERSYTPGCGNTIRLFKAAIDPGQALAAAEAVSDLPEAKILKKELVLDLAAEAGGLADERLARYLENFEGLTFGPELPDGTPTLLMVSDDNRGGDQINSLLRIRMSSLPTADAKRWRSGDRPVFAAECN